MHEDLHTGCSAKADRATVDIERRHTSVELDLADGAAIIEGYASVGEHQTREFRRIIVVGGKGGGV